MRLSDWTAILLLSIIFILKMSYGSAKLSVFISCISVIFIFRLLEGYNYFKIHASLGLSVGVYLILTMLIIFFTSPGLSSLDFTRSLSSRLVHSLFSEDFRSTDMMPYLGLAVFALFLFLKLNERRLVLLLAFIFLVLPILKFDKSNLWLMFFSFFFLTLIPRKFYKTLNYVVLVAFLTFPILVVQCSIIYGDDLFLNLITSGRVEIWSSASKELLKNSPWNVVFGVGHDFTPFMRTPYSEALTYDEVSYHSGLFRFMAQDGYLLYAFCCILIHYYIERLGLYGIYILVFIFLYNVFDGSFFSNFTFHPFFIFPVFILKSLVKVNNSSNFVDNEKFAF